jgi:molecular chaperone DnaK (HSP70)
MLAIDFGTTRSKAAYVDPKIGRATLCRLGRGDHFAMPSLIFVAQDGTEVVGPEAQDLIDNEPAGGIRVLKRQLRERAKGWAEGGKCIVRLGRIGNKMTREDR